MSKSSEPETKVQWQVIVREWHREGGRLTDIGAAIETTGASDRPTAVAIARSMLARHGHRARVGVDLEVSIAAMDEQVGL